MVLHIGLICAVIIENIPVSAHPGYAERVRIKIITGLISLLKNVRIFQSLRHRLQIIPHLISVHIVKNAKHNEGCHHYRQHRNTNKL